MSDFETTPSAPGPESGPGPEGSARYHHRRPIERSFYERLRAGIDDAAPTQTELLGPAGTVVSIQAGDLLALSQEEDAQVVLVYAWNRHEPRERIWTNETSSVENCFMVPMSRLWSTMPWFRALLTLLDDTVETVDTPGEPIGRHHFVLDGWETPATWAADGGAASIHSAWDRFERLLSERGVDPRLHRDHVALFRKVAIDPATQRLRMMRSDARAGDRVVLYSEMDLDLALVPSPYGAGGLPASEMDGHVAPVRIDSWASGLAPLGWPYPDLPYPDIAPYVEALDSGSA
jgi:uncharacterized protein YcgI (DUF1989 family)